MWAFNQKPHLGGLEQLLWAHKWPVKPQGHLIARSILPCEEFGFPPFKSCISHQANVALLSGHRETVSPVIPSFMRTVRWADPSSTGDPRKATLQEIWLWAREELEQENGDRKFQGNCPEDENVWTHTLSEERLRETYVLGLMSPRSPIRQCLGLFSQTGIKVNAQGVGREWGRLCSPSWWSRPVMKTTNPMFFFLKKQPT